MAKPTRTTGIRKTPASKSRPASKTAEPRGKVKPKSAAEPVELADPLDEALADTFPSSDPVAIGQSDRIGEPGPPEVVARGGIMGFIQRLLGIGRQ